MGGEKKGWGDQKVGEELEFGGGAGNRKSDGKPPHSKKSGEKRQTVDEFEGEGPSAPEGGGLRMTDR